MNEISKFREFGRTYLTFCQAAVIHRRGEIVDDTSLLKQFNEGEEEVPLQAILVEIIWVAVACGNEDDVSLPEAFCPTVSQLVSTQLLATEVCPKQSGIEAKASY